MPKVSHSCLRSHVENRRLNVGKLEGVSDVHANVVRVYSVFQETVKEAQLTVVFLVAHVRVDRDAVVEVEGERQDRVVNDAHLLTLAVKDDVQVLDEEVVQLDAVLPVQTLLEDRVLRVNVVQDLVSVLLLACCEHNDFVPLAQFFKNILNEWS